MSFNMDQLRILVDKDIDGKETVSFNYPKYEKIGTPRDVWLSNINDVEVTLEDILDKQPWKDEFPLIHLRREEKDQDGNLIRVHFDLFGRTTLVKFAMEMLNVSVNMYVTKNTLSSDKGQKLLDKLPPDMLDIISKNPNGFLDIVPVNSSSKESIKAQVIAHLEAKGLPTDNIQIMNSKALEIPENSLTKLSDDDVPTGPLDFGFANEVDTNDNKESLPFFLMPNPNPDEIN